MISASRSLRFTCGNGIPGISLPRKGQSAFQSSPFSHETTSNLSGCPSNTKCLELLNDAHIDVIKGNASEVARVAGESVKTRGVDATEVGGDLAVLAQQLANQRNATVVVTGQVDIVTDGKKTYRIANGHAMMAHVVGTGCMAASVIGAFAAVERDQASAAACALAIFGIAAEVAAEQAPGPAAFKQRLFDCLYSLDRATVDRLQRIRLKGNVPTPQFKPLWSSAARSRACVNISMLPSAARGHCSRGRSQ